MKKRLLMIGIVVVVLALTMMCQSAKPTPTTETPTPTTQPAPAVVNAPTTPVEQPTTQPATENPAPIPAPVVQPATETSAPAIAPIVTPVPTPASEPAQVTVVRKTADEGYQFEMSRIFFKPFTADYMDVPQAAQNTARLDKLAAMLKDIDNKNLKLVGHAVKIYWFNQKLGDREQKDILIPLSEKRAQVILKALADRGVEVARFATVQGVGATDQIVPDSDLKNRWQNRRVELFLN